MKNDKPAYRLFEQNGNKSSYKDMLKDASEADIVFFGELHDNPICQNGQCPKLSTPMLRINNLLRAQVLKKVRVWCSVKAQLN